MGDQPQRVDLHEGAWQRSVRPGEARQVEGSAQSGHQGHERGSHVRGGLHRGGQGHDVRRGVERPLKISRKLDEKEEVNKERNMGIENKGEMRERNKKKGGN